MNNVSDNGQDLLLRPNNIYYIIDALYLDKIKENINDLKLEQLDTEIREKIFPYTYAPFAKVSFSQEHFRVRDIKKVDYDDLSTEDTSCFFSDTGLIILIDESLLITFIKEYDYEELVDSIVETLNYGYWEKITSSFDSKKTGLILSPGVNSGYVFEGNGLYKITE